jgi:hypothetical protein
LILLCFYPYLQQMDCPNAGRKPLGPPQGRTVPQVFLGGRKVRYGGQVADV